MRAFVCTAHTSPPIREIVLYRPIITPIPELSIKSVFSKSKIIVNIDGLEWRRNKWGTFAKKFLKISEAISIRIADIIISDNQAIADYVENKYNKKSVVIAYGGDHATNLSTPIDDDQKKDGYYLGLCRIEPENNIEMILNAFINTDKKINLWVIGIIASMGAS